MNYINIEDIMMRNQQLILENEALRLRIEDLKNGFEGSCMACEHVGEMNKKLRAERDDARREVCNNKANHLPTMSDPYREAKRRGWDCFKD
jgi:hypothetical protein